MSLLNSSPALKVFDYIDERGFALSRLPFLHFRDFVLPTIVVSGLSFNESFKSLRLSKDLR